MNVDFDAMTDHELKRYFLTHRDDESFHAYMDRRYARSNRRAIIEAGELDNLPFEEQVKITAERMNAHFGDKLDQKNGGI